MKFTLASGVICALITLFVNNSFSQVLRSQMEKGAFDIGAVYKQFERKQTPSFSDGTIWGSGSIYFRYGISDWLTTSMEGIVFDSSPRYPTDHRNLRTYLFGLGIDTRIYEVEGYQILAGLQYAESIDFDKSNVGEDQQNKNLLAAIRVARSLPVFNQPLVIWCGPSYAYDQYVSYPQHVKTVSNSTGNFGFSFGFDVVIFDHIAFFPHVVYANFLQPRVGVGYKF